MAEPQTDLGEYCQPNTMLAPYEDKQEDEYTFESPKKPYNSSGRELEVLQKSDEADRLSSIANLDTKSTISYNSTKEIPSQVIAQNLLMPKPP